MKNKNEMTIELAMRFAVGLRLPGMLNPSGMLKFSPTSGYTAAERQIDVSIARLTVVMAEIYVEAWAAARVPAGPVEPSSSPIEAPEPDDDLEKTRIRF